MNNSLLLKDKIAIVTGASRGIGQVTALELAKSGAFVIGTATSEAGAEKIRALFREHKLSGDGTVLNVCDSLEALTEQVGKMAEQYGTPTILVNNAGITRDNLLLRMKSDQWDEVINTNLNSAYRMTKACLKGMFKARWGRIVNIASVVGTMGNAGQANYAAAKAGLIGFSKAVAIEMASTGITVNVVAPGFIQTDMTSELSEKAQEMLFNQIPMKRLGLPVDVANAVVFLASDAAAYITGHTLHVNGGMLMV